MLHLALYQPDIPQNLGAAIRLAACLDVTLHIIEPCGFPFDEKRIRRTGMDYINHATLVRHAGWSVFHATVPGRLILLSTKASTRYTDFQFQPEDILLMGRESSGVPPEIHAMADARLHIPMNPNCRSLNVINAAAMVLGEGMRQLTTLI